MELYAIRTRFVSASNLLDIAQSGDKTSPDEYKREPIKLLCNCELLVVDDIGQKKNGQEWMSDIMYKIADERFKKQLSTIYTSNLKVDELNLNEATIERMKLGIFLEIKLPEFNVRSRESYNEKVSFMKEIGLLKGGDEDN
jgi:DNA replication protein DnaC